MALKIAIIGGGSAYAPGLVRAFLQHGRVFGGAELALMDIAAHELSIVTRLAQRMAQATGVEIRITATTDQQQAVVDANYVLTTFRQGGLEARHQDEAVPLEFGVVGQETLGPGGFFFAMRTLTAMKRLVDDIKALAPNAVIVNYTNPTQIVAEAITHFGGVPCLSICDQSLDDQHKIVEALGQRPEVVEFESVGLNHATWSSRFLIDGEDGVEQMIRHAGRVLARPDLPNRLKRQFRLTEAYGRVPNSYLQYYYFREETLAEALAEPRTRAQVIMESLPGYFRHYAEQSESAVPTLTHVRGGSVFGDVAVEVLRSLIVGDHQIHTLNVANRGALPGFARDRVVEVPARLETKGATPLAQEALPHEVMGLLGMLAEYQWLAADAIWNGDRMALDRALAANPLVLSIKLARRLLDTIIPLQCEYLGEHLQ